MVVLQSVLPALGHHGLVGFEARYGLDGPGFEHRYGQGILSCTYPFKLSLGPTQLRVPGLFPERKATGLWV